MIRYATTKTIRYFSNNDLYSCYIANPSLHDQLVEWIDFRSSYLYSNDYRYLLLTMVNLRTCFED